MPSLPNNPNLDHFRQQAKTLLRAAKSGDERALELIARPRSNAADPDLMTLAAAQFAVARGYGFSGWPQLKHYLDTAEVLRRDPTAGLPETDADPADAFCRLACLVYSEKDGPERWAAARAVLTDHPDIAAHSMAAAAAAADPEAIRGHLTADRRAANTENGPHRWAPLMYLTYSRALRGDEPAERFLLSARLLLDAGADPNAGYLWSGLTPAFTALTGVFGEGEQGPGRQPRHPHSLALARLLLTRGADPNDGQTLYNRMFRPDDSHLELLCEFGLGRGDGGPWKRRLGEAAETPTEMLARQLEWAIDHGLAARVDLLAGNGVDVRAPLADGRSPAQRAADGGRLDIAAILTRHGGRAPVVHDSARLLDRLLTGGGGTNIDPGIDALAACRSRWPDLIHRATTPEAVQRVAEAGFDVDARRGGATALHQAAWNGALALVRALLDAGADPDARDDHFGATPLGWAEHGYQEPACRLLAADGSAQ
jgi:hypothetical protein